MQSLSSSYVIPVALSVFLHAVLVVTVAWGWEAKPERREIDIPNYVPIKKYELKATTPKVAAPKPKPKKIDLTAQRAEEERKKKLAEQRRLSEQKRLQAEKDRQEQEKMEKAQAERQRLEREQREADQRRREEQLADALLEEEELLQGEEDEEMAQSYVEAIRDRIQQNWRLPPSARNGMECELSIQMVPTGRVVDVTITKSSGNAAFDRSAEQAVLKVEQFPEIKEIPSRVFEQNFRHFTMRFRPEDLRQ